MNLLTLGLLVLAVGKASVCSDLPLEAENRIFIFTGGCITQNIETTLPPGTHATFISPSYPNNYAPFSGCTWNFRTSGASVLRLLCPEVYLSLFAKIVVWDGSSSRWYTCVLCSIPLSIDQTFSSQNVKIQFSNPFILSGKGFSCAITATAPGETCRCGTSAGRRIVGGAEAQQGEYPWMAGVVNKGEDFSFCGGALISSQYVVTAAHCTRNPSSLSLEVRLGVLEEGTMPTTEVRRQVLEIINHNLYDDTTYDYDISLLRIQEVDFSATPSVRPICLPLSSVVNLEGKSVEVAGWGALSAGGQHPQNLLKVTVPVVSNGDCRNQLGSSATITARMFCAGATGKDSCQGDSGGPTMLRVGAYYELVGVVSFGRGCGQANTPGVYTRVSEFLQWIMQNADEGDTCPRP